MPTAAPSEVAAEAAAAPSFKCPPYEVLRATVLDLSKPVAQRMRCVFYLRTLGGEDAIATLCEGTWQWQRTWRWAVSDTHTHVNPPPTQR